MGHLRGLWGFLGGLSGFLVVLYALLMPHHTYADSFCITCLKFTIGPAELVLGPVAVPADSAVVFANAGPSYFGYSANGASYRLSGRDLEHLTFDNAAVISRGPVGNFDECGAWIQAFAQDGKLIRGWYHAEEKCDYSISQTRKSVAYAESTDGGLTFQKVGYPNNQVIVDPVPFQANINSGQGDHSVIKWGDYYYMYFLITDAVWKTGVARASLSSGGTPGSWLKWYDGSFSMPGINGPATPIGIPGAAYASVYASANNIALLASAPEFGGLRLSFSANGIDFTDLPEPLLAYTQYDWVRDATKQELIAYASIVPDAGGAEWSNAFYLFYTYLQPGEGFGQKYLVRRKVSVAASPSRVSPQVNVALSRYYSVTHRDYWSTTALTPGNFSFQKTLGYVFTRSQTAMTQLIDCYNASTDDHIVEQGTCAAGNQQLRQLGYVWSVGQPGTSPLYRCYDRITGNHFVASSADCDGLGATEFILGYAITAVPPSSGASTEVFHGASDFSSTQGLRNWYYLDSLGNMMTFDATNNRWKGNEEFLLVTQDGGHPGIKADSVRRWKAPASGTVFITGNSYTLNRQGGDGVLLTIKKNTEIVWQQSIANGNTTGSAIGVATIVNPGDNVDFAISKVGTNNLFDLTYFNPRIEFTASAAQNFQINQRPGFASRR